MPTKSNGSGKAARTKERKFAADQGRTVLFPDVETFSGIFEGVDPGKKIVAVIQSDYDKKAKMGISNFVSLSSGGSFYASPKKEVLQLIERNMVIVAYDEIYFKIVIRSKNSALVVAQHNQIIGSRWLAIIDPKTVPSIKSKD